MQHTDLRPDIRSRCAESPVECQPARRGGGKMELTKAMAALLQKTADAFHGAQRRRYMAEAVEAFDLSQRQAERQLGWLTTQFARLCMSSTLASPVWTTSRLVVA